MLIFNVTAVFIPSEYKATENKRFIWTPKVHKAPKEHSGYTLGHVNGPSNPHSTAKTLVGDPT